MGAACTALFALALPTGTSDANPPDADLASARTLVFVTLSTFQLFYVCALRSATRSCVDRGLATNWRLLGAVAIGFVLQYVVVYVPLLQPWFRTVPLSLREVGLATAVGASALLGAEAWKLIGRLRKS
jgi:Ca2+-transporting ATPase